MHTSYAHQQYQLYAASDSLQITSRPPPPPPPSALTNQNDSQQTVGWPLHLKFDETTPEKQQKTQRRLVRPSSCHQSNSQQQSHNRVTRGTLKSSITQDNQIQDSYSKSPPPPLLLKKTPLKDRLEVIERQLVRIASSRVQKAERKESDSILKKIDERLILHHASPPSPPRSAEYYKQKYLIGLSERVLLRQEHKQVVARKDNEMNEARLSNEKFCQELVQKCQLSAQNHQQLLLQLEKTQRRLAYSQSQLSQATQSINHLQATAQSTAKLINSQNALTTVRRQQHYHPLSLSSNVEVTPTKTTTATTSAKKDRIKEIITRLEKDNSQLSSVLAAEALDKAAFLKQLSELLRQTCLFSKQAFTTAEETRFTNLGEALVAVSLSFKNLGGGELSKEDISFSFQEPHHSPSSLDERTLLRGCKEDGSQVGKMGGGSPYEYQDLLERQEETEQAMATLVRKKEEADSRCVETQRLLSKLTEDHSQLQISLNDQVKARQSERTCQQSKLVILETTNIILTKQLDRASMKLQRSQQDCQTLKGQLLEIQSNEGQLLDRCHQVEEQLREEIFQKDIMLRKVQIKLNSLAVTEEVKHQGSISSAMLMADINHRESQSTRDPHCPYSSSTEQDIQSVWQRSEVEGEELLIEDKLDDKLQSEKQKVGDLEEKVNGFEQLIMELHKTIKEMSCQTTLQQQQIEEEKKLREEVQILLTSTTVECTRLEGETLQLAKSIVILNEEKEQQLVRSAEQLRASIDEGNQKSIGLLEVSETRLHIAEAKVQSLLEQAGGIHASLQTAFLVHDSSVKFKQGSRCESEEEEENVLDALNRLADSVIRSHEQQVTLTEKYQKQLNEISERNQSLEESQTAKIESLLKQLRDSATNFESNTEKIILTSERALEEQRRETSEKLSALAAELSEKDRRVSELVLAVASLEEEISLREQEIVSQEQKQTRDCEQQTGQRIQNESIEETVSADVETDAAGVIISYIPETIMQQLEEEWRAKEREYLKGIREGTDRAESSDLELQHLRAALKMREEEATTLNNMIEQQIEERNSAAEQLRNAENDLMEEKQRSQDLTEQISKTTELLKDVTIEKRLAEELLRELKEELQSTVDRLEQNEQARLESESYLKQELSSNKIQVEECMKALYMAECAVNKSQEEVSSFKQKLGDQQGEVEEQMNVLQLQLIAERNKLDQKEKEATRLREALESRLADASEELRRTKESVSAYTEEVPKQNVKLMIEETGGAPPGSCEQCASTIKILNEKLGEQELLIQENIAKMLQLQQNLSLLQTGRHRPEPPLTVESIDLSDQQIRDRMEFLENTLQSQSQQISEQTARIEEFLADKEQSERQAAYLQNQLSAKVREIETLRESTAVDQEIVVDLRGGGEVISQSEVESGSSARSFELSAAETNRSVMSLIKNIEILLAKVLLDIEANEEITQLSLYHSHNLASVISKLSARLVLAPSIEAVISPRIKELAGGIADFSTQETSSLTKPANSSIPCDGATKEKEILRLQRCINEIQMSEGMLQGQMIQLKRELAMQSENSEVSSSILKSTLKTILPKFLAAASPTDAQQFLNVILNLLEVSEPEKRLIIDQTFLNDKKKKDKKKKTSLW